MEFPQTISTRPIRVFHIYDKRLTDAAVKLRNSMKRQVPPKQTTPSSPSVKTWWARRRATYIVSWKKTEQMTISMVLKSSQDETMVDV